MIRAWNIMGGLEWDALPTVAEMVGIEDVELLIESLVMIRKHQKEQHG